MVFNLHLSLSKAISLSPKKEAVVDGQKRFTYEELGKRIGRLAHALLELGLRQGSVVGIIAPNCHEYMETYYACASLGLVLNPINFRLNAREMADILADSDAACLVAHQDFADQTKEILTTSCAIKNLLVIQSSFKSLDLNPSKSSQCDLLNYFGDDRHQTAKSLQVFDFEHLLNDAKNDTIPFNPCKSDDLAHLYYTSGTTGKCKGVMLTHLNVTANALGAISELRLSEDVTWGHFAPIFHLADAWAIFSVTWVAGKHVYIPYFKPVDALNAISREKVSLTALVPTMVNQILAYPELKNFDLASLETLMTAGSPIAPQQVKRIIKELGCDYCQFYGLTEKSPFLTIGTIKPHLKLLPEDQLIELKSRTGRAFISTELKVVNEKGFEIAQDNKEVGEIIARGPNVTQGYWKQPQATAQSFRDGWFHTGDLATVDRDGYLNIVDRCKDMIISGGENIYSTEVEYSIYEHESILECAVFGIPDDKWGELVKAVIVPKPGHVVSSEEIVAHLKERLATYKLPKSIDVVEELPKTGSGKIFKKALRDQYWSRSRRVN